MKLNDAQGRASRRQLFCQNGQSGPNALKCLKILHKHVVFYNVWSNKKKKKLKYYLFGKHGDVFVEGLRRAHVTARYAWIPGRARG